MDHPAKVVQARILDRLAMYQRQIGEDRYIVLLFGGFGKEIPLFFKELIYLEDETLCFKGVNLETVQDIDVIQNYQLINFVVSFVEKDYSDFVKRYEKPVQIADLIENLF